ncbi:hypothetical protein Y032_0303g1882 [Ancylostoma ceylanicum]|uniref:Uncharacterized protein n=1 Tax=Ancylostoma ceylanicum TaxID=53326 RepID=A0A016S3X1_9BILA|nr:hypothetical protein Y032_0303g1882 [Ancylostoma ceylanicum]
MDGTAISLHLIKLSADNSSPESYDIDYITFVVETICDFIQHAVEGFLHTHPHPSSVKSVNLRELNVVEQVIVHHEVSDLMNLLKQLRQKTGYHVCFLRGCRDTVPSLFESGVAVVPLPELHGHHYKEILSQNSHDNLSSLGFAAGAALHEIGHLASSLHINL